MLNSSSRLNLEQVLGSRHLEKSLSHMKIEAQVFVLLASELHKE